MKKLMVALTDGNKEFFEGEDPWYDISDGVLSISPSLQERAEAVFSAGTWSYVRVLKD